MGASKKISGGNALADFFCNEMDRQSNVPYKNTVETKSNLSSEVLLDILNSLGIDTSNFATRLKFIDSNLVNPRNHIAHGEELHISVSDYMSLHDDVISLIDIYRNEIENASVQRLFERA